MQTGPSYTTTPTDMDAPYGEVRAEGTLGRRFMAYLLDFLIIFGFTLLLYVAVSVLGILTFGFAWLLFPVLGPIAAVLYSAMTVGGPHQATVGMRVAGVRMINLAGGRVDGVTAAVHALLFYVAAGTFVLWLLDLAIGFARADRRLGHDLLCGLAAVRTG